MIKKDKVSLWLGKFSNEAAFNQYIDVKYDEDGNLVPSKFQKDYQIAKYDLDAIESDWIENRCASLNDLLTGFTCYEEILPVAESLMCSEKSKYNSIVLMYNFEFKGVQAENSNLKFIGSMDAHL